MTDRLTKTCELGFGHYAELLFRGGENAFAACLREQPDPIELYFRLLDLDNKAKRARAWFASREPCRFQPLPLVYYDEQENIMCSGDLARHLTVYYSQSLRRRDFDYLNHPLFYDFARGVMADRN